MLWELIETVPRLISQLYEESIFISIGHRDFQIPRDIFSDPGNSPNYFSLGFGVFFSTPSEVFPGLSRDGLLRPPSIQPPSVPNRSADTFDELLQLLRGYPIQIKSEAHRAELLRDCRYFHLKGLEQKLIRHSISFNLLRGREEITLRLEDVRQSGISVVGDTNSSMDETPGVQGGFTRWVNYARPFVDDKPRNLILEIGNECTRVHLQTMRAEFFGDGKMRITKLFEVIATKLNLPTTQPLGLLMATGGASSAPASPGNTPISEDQVRILLDQDSYVCLDGRELKAAFSSDGDGQENLGSTAESPGSSVMSGQPPQKKRRGEGGALGVSLESGVPGEEDWVVKTGQWRLKVQNGRNGKGRFECVLVAVKLDAISSELGRNAQRSFLG